MRARDPAPTLRHRVLAYIHDHNCVSLATDGPEGLWAATVMYVPDGTRLYFTSAPETRHARNLAATGRAAGTINEDSGTFEDMSGVQLEGVVEPVDDVDERAAAIAGYLEKFPFASALWQGRTDPRAIARDPGGHPIFRITPTRLYFMDNRHAPGVREELPPPA